MTELEFQLHQVGPIVYAGLARFYPAQAREVIAIWRDISAEASEGLGWAVASITAPPEPFVPAEWHGKRMWGVVGQFVGPQDEAERIMKPLRALKPVVDLFQPMPYTMIQGLIDGANPYGRRNYWRAHNLEDLGENVIDTMIEVAGRAASPFTALLALNMAGAIDRLDDNATALGGRSAPFNVHLNCMWEGRDGDEANIAWTREATEAFAPAISPGMALNFSTEVGDAEVRDSFGDTKVARLRGLKNAYDPTNLFRLNQNIRPN